MGWRGGKSGIDRSILRRNARTGLLQEVIEDSRVAGAPGEDLGHDRQQRQHPGDGGEEAAGEALQRPQRAIEADDAPRAARPFKAICRAMAAPAGMADDEVRHPPQLAMSAAMLSAMASSDRLEAKGARVKHGPAGPAPRR